MANKAKENGESKTNSANLGFEEKLWKAADKMRSNMDAAEYKHVVLGLIFLKYISDAFEDKHTDLVEEDTTKYIVSEDRDEYAADNIFFVPKKARWKLIQENAKKPEIGKIIDEAMEAIEKENATLKGVLTKNYARESLNKQRIGELIDLISTIGLGDKESKKKDILGRVYEYFLGQFADAEGKSGGQFYTPQCIVKILVNMIEPYKGRVFDPCCGSGGMFVQSEKFVNEHQGRVNDIAIFGQESNQTTWRLCRMNLAIRGIAGDIVWNDQGSFLKDAHQNLKADFVLANPPFNDNDWHGDLLRDDVRWKYGVPPTGNANYAWLQHIIHHLSPNGIAGVVLADSSLTTEAKEEFIIKKKFVDERIVDCVISLPSHLFFNTRITACLWFLKRNKKNTKFQNREDEILFIDASKMGTIDTRNHKILLDKDIQNISSIYHDWNNINNKFEDIKGVCRSVKYDEIKRNNYYLAPSRYVETKKQEVNVDFDIEDKTTWKQFNTLITELNVDFDRLRKNKKNNQLNQAWNISRYLKKLNILTADLYCGIISKHFLAKQNMINKKIPEGWELKKFKDIFEERKLTVKEHGFCPSVYSLTNSGIQQREGNFSKELSKSSDGYKVALRGDMVFGLSREIPNLDVFTDEVGAFSPAYSVFKPNDIRLGLIIGCLMRLKLMEQIDILKGGAREGRGLDKEKLKQKEYILPNNEELNKYFEVMLD
jgi:type I restriction enzyme M protein